MSDFMSESKKEYEPANGREIDNDDLKTGALQRIAAATETMARSYAQLIAERDRYKRWYEDECKESARLNRRLIAMRGVITKLRGKLAAA